MDWQAKALVLADELEAAEALNTRYREALERIKRAMAEEEWGDDFEAVVAQAVDEALSSPADSQEQG